MNRFAEGNTRTIVLLLFFLSGACTLVYEIVWVRMLVLVFGTSVYAVSTVLSAFMAGLALGSALFGRLVDRRGNPMRIYA
jgi:spermidine synthase